MCSSFQALLLTQHYSNSCEYRSITIFQLDENLSGFWLIMSPRLTLSSWLQLVRFLSVTRGRRFFFLCSSIYPKLTICSSLPSCKPLPLYDQTQKVHRRLHDMLVKSIRALHSRASLPWVGSQLISTAIIKCWSLPDGQTLIHEGADENIVFLGSLPVPMTTYPQQMLICLLFVL